MRNTARVISTVSSVAALLGSFALAIPGITHAADEATIAEGQKLAFDRKKGNCLACHQIEGGRLAGNIGPPLVAMKARFPDKAKLHAQISEPRQMNPNTIMPPFGAHGIMSKSEIDKVVEYIHTL